MTTQLWSRRRRFTDGEKLLNGGDKSGWTGQILPPLFAFAFSKRMEGGIMFAVRYFYNPLTIL